MRKDYFSQTMENIFIYSSLQMIPYWYHIYIWSLTWSVLLSVHTVYSISDLCGLKKYTGPSWLFLSVEWVCEEFVISVSREAYWVNTTLKTSNTVHIVLSTGQSNKSGLIFHMLWYGTSARLYFLTHMLH